MISPDKVFSDLKPNELASGPNSVDWVVEPNLPYLDGHFPGTPILPAIAMVDASMHLLKEVLQSRALRLTNVAQAKFLSPIVPGQALRIEWKVLGQGSAQVTWKERADDRMLANLTLEYSE